MEQDVASPTLVLLARAEWVAHLFAHIGVAETLVLYKAYACGLLVMLHRITPPRVGIPIMRGLAAVYCVFSLGPWLGKFASVVAHF